MARFIITSVVPPAGKGPYKIGLQDESGRDYKFVKAWPSEWHYSELENGREVFGSLESRVNGQYTDLVLVKAQNAVGGASAQPAARPSSYPPRSPVQPFQRKPNNIAAAMAQKEQGIQKAQDNKEAGIILSSTFRDATLLTIAQMGKDIDMSDEGFKGTWLKWRGWLLDQYSRDPREIERPNTTSPGYGGQEEINPEDIPF